MTTKRINAVWALLTGVTLLSWWLGTERVGGGLHANTAITVAVLSIAAVKVRFVLREFMAVRTAPRWLRRATDGWLVVLWGTVLVIYLI